MSEQTQKILPGRLYELITPYLDGRPAQEICDRLDGKVSPAQVFYTLAQLEQKGYLSESEDVFPLAESAYWTSQQIEPTLVARRLQDSPIHLHSVGDVDVQPMRILLQSLGVHFHEDATLTVVVTDHYLRDGLQSWNEKALTTGRPWLLFKPVGQQIWLGPLFQPGQTGCWNCLAERMRANSPLLDYLEGKLDRDGSSAGDLASTPASMQIAWGRAATAITSWIVRQEIPHLLGKLRTLDVLTDEVQSHTLVRLPFCRACGTCNTSNGLGHPWHLQSSIKAYAEDGGHRAVSPEETLQRHGHHVSPITGAVSMLKRDGPADNNVLHVYLSGHNVARRARDFQTLRGDLRSSNCGKGITDAQARASALCEGLERYSAVFRGDEPRRRARWVDLGDAGIDPRSCLLYSNHQYRDREALNAKGPGYDQIPLPFDPQAEIEWTPVWSMTRQTTRYLPTAFCYFNYPQNLHQAFCFSCSNGNAAGNTKEEAILQGFLELVERDSVALWWYNRVQRPGIDLDSFAEPYLAQLRSFLEGHQRDLWALDLTSDLGIPVFVAASRKLGGGPEQILFGFGAHLEARMALLRAVTELNQMLSGILHLAPGSPPEGHFTDPATVHWLRTATTANQPYLEPQDEPLRTHRSFSSSWNKDLKDDILFCQHLVEQRGMEMVVLDQTRAEIGLPVVKVIVPGLRHFWRRFAPGRLYDVPVQLGWRKQPLTEDQLNPISMFL